MTADPLLARNRIVRADLAAVVARADQRRAASADLVAVTEGLSATSSAS